MATLALWDRLQYQNIVGGYRLYVCLKRIANVINSCWCGQTLESISHTRRVLRLITAPIFNSFSRMNRQRTFAMWVP